MAPGCSRGPPFRERVHVTSFRIRANRRSTDRSGGVSPLQPRSTRTSRTWASIALALALAAATVALATPASAQLAPPWDGTPISAGLGPTYGEPWCAEAAPGSSIANQQDFDGPAFQDTLALLPQEAIACTLDQIIQEGADAGLPSRMTYSVIGTTDAGRDLYGVVVNALETPEQQRDYDRWVQLRQLMFKDPARAQGLLDSFGDDVKVPIFIEANIHGGEEEGTDAMMQVVRDLVTLPYGTNPVVDDLLDHAILILIPSQNPDGRFLGTRANGNGFDMNRDLLVQSQPEMRANIALQLEWLAPVMLAMHGYVNPTLIDGLTKPHNPGLEYDLFLNWNPSRLDANEAALAAIQQGITRPVDDYGPNGGQAADITTTGATQTGTTVTITTDEDARSGRRAGGRDRRRRRLGLQRHVHDHVGPDDHHVHLRDDRGPRALRLRGRVHRQPGDRGGLGRLGALLHADLRRVLRRRRLDARDVQQPGVWRPVRVEARPVRRLLLVGRVLDLEPAGDPRRPARDLPPGRDRGAEAELLRRRAGRGSRVHRDAAQLDGAVPRGVRDPVGRQSRRIPAPVRGRAAQPGRGEPPRAVAARQRRPAPPHDRGLRLRGADAREALLRRVHGPGPPGVRVHGARGGPGHLGPDHPAVRATGCVEPRAAVGRRHDRGPGRRGVRPAGPADRLRQPAGRRRSRRRPGQLVRPGDQGSRGGSSGPRAAARGCRR